MRNKTPRGKANHRNPTNKRQRVTKKRRSWPAFVFLTGLVGCAIFITYLYYLDQRVRQQFEGKRWSVPARVYARPLELYPGLELSAQEFFQELDALGYRAGASVNGPGSYSRDRNVFHVISDPFTFWDGDQPAIGFRAVFRGTQLTMLQDLDTRKPLPLMRLNPIPIGGIYPSHNEDRILVQLEDVPKRLIDTLLAVEDRNFYQHNGIHVKAIARAMVANLREMAWVQGGSTITQQLVKNFYLSHERKLVRKFNEVLMAFLLEWHYDKNEILQAYLNEIYLGQAGGRAIHGFGLASQFYFQRSISALSNDQIALLVALVKGPSYYDPRRNPKRAQARRDLVLDMMHAQDLLSAQQVAEAKQQGLQLSTRSSISGPQYPAFLQLVRRQLQRDYDEQDLSSEGLRIFTTFDPRMQKAAEQSLSEKIDQFERDGRVAKDVLQGAVVVTAVNSGEILALVSDRNPRFSGFNRAVDALRPIGSLIKPAVFLTALSSADYHLATPLEDGPLRIEMEDGSLWEPQNYDEQFHGNVMLYEALAYSYNVSTARMGLAIGIDRIVQTLRKLGVQRPVHPYPSLLLGTLNLAPLDVAQMYQTFASSGFPMHLRAIREVADAHGNPLQRYPLALDAALDPRAVYLLNWNLQQAAMLGTGRGVYRNLSSQVAVAGKTGTTDDLRDSWFAGFAADTLAVVWLGRDDNKPAGLTGGSGAAVVWGDVMSRIRPQSLQLLPPTGVEWRLVDLSSALLADEHCKDAVQLPFKQGVAPRDFAPCAIPDRVPAPARDALDWIRGLFQ